MATRVGVVGAAGRMGLTACWAVAEAADLELVAAVAPSKAGQPLRALGGPDVDLEAAANLDALAAAGAQVAVEFTVASAAPANLLWCAQAGIHAVSGTTGLAEAEVARLGEAFRASRANCVLAPNFAISAALLLRFAELAAPYFEGVEVVELHHERKRDAPSGTAIETARRIAAAREASPAGPLPVPPAGEEVLASARGALGPGGVRIHALRLPGAVAHEEVRFGGPGEALTIRQDSFDRRSFVPGILLAVRRVASTPGLTLGIGPLLGW
ncbi:MAG TPA: 4-hydroxy-tetrahydrodipicolinate reductase [Acidimicrobiales bacterium]|nr:4-hydroxy-tetrahydrodipicolinate reductase [Acidimicrobiales bacterium]